MKKRKIIALTGIRSEYDIMSSVFSAINNSPLLDLQLVVTGAHLSKEHGYTVNEIKKDGHNIAYEIQSLVKKKTLSSRLHGLGTQLQGLAKIISKLNPDILLVLGDREESIAIALAGSYLNIAVAHIGGGDRVVGNIDDQIRHAVTKLSHIHFTTNFESHARIISLGEQPFRVFNVGNPGLDRMVNTKKIKLNTLSKLLGFPLLDKEPYIILIQHPLSSEYHLAYEQMKITLNALSDLGLQVIIIYPNSDAGSEQIIKAIKEFKEQPNFFISKNLPRTEFVNLLRNASCLVGNSSAGILEAPLLKLPVVNIGNRQIGRMHSTNIQFVTHEHKKILIAIKKAIYNQSYIKTVKGCKNPYGNGDSSYKIAKILSKIKLNKKLLIKDITY